MTSGLALRAGDVAIARIEEVRIPNRIEYFTQDDKLLDRHRHWLYPHYLDDRDGFDLVFQSFVFEADGRVVLVDPCTGNGKPHPVPYFNQLDVPFIERMEQTGFRPQDVDFVICTHLHHDHCGWNTMLRDGKWVPSFPNARYVFQQAEYLRWGRDSDLHPDFALNVGVFERSVQPIVEAGLADLLNGDAWLTESLAIEFAPGHTIGHQMLHLRRPGSHALFTGDCFHHPIQLVDVENAFGEAENPAQVATMRRKLVDIAANEGVMLIPAHLPAPHGVRASLEGETIRFFASSCV